MTKVEELRDVLTLARGALEAIIPQTPYLHDLEARISDLLDKVEPVPSGELPSASWFIWR